MTAFHNRGSTDDTILIVDSILLLWFAKKTIDMNITTILNNT